MTIQDFIIEAKQDLRAYLDSIGEEDVEITDQNIVKANDTAEQHRRAECLSG